MLARTVLIDNYSSSEKNAAKMRLAGQPRTDFFTRDLLTPYVRNVLGEPNAEVTQWDHDLVKGGLIPPNRGIFRLTGTAGVGKRKAIPWSMYLKIARRDGRGVSKTYFDPTQREALFYQLELSRTMTGAMTVPSCLGVQNVEDDAPWVFLKEIDGTTRESWPAERYGAVARHLGQFQGEFLTGRPFPSEEWVDRRHWLRLEHSGGLSRRKTLLDELSRHELAP